MRASKDEVWNKGTITPGYDKDIQRQDSCNAWIRYADYGFRRELGFGWEIDHILPEANNYDDLMNLQPLQWQNNVHKTDNLYYFCKVTSKDEKNVFREDYNPF